MEKNAGCRRNSERFGGNKGIEKKRRKFGGFRVLGGGRGGEGLKITLDNGIGGVEAGNNSVCGGTAAAGGGRGSEREEMSRSGKRRHRWRCYDKTGA